MDIIRFLKNWTLPVSMAAGTILYLIFAYTPVLEHAANFFDPIFDFIFPLFMFLILFVTFCKVDFKKMRPVKWHLWVGMFQVIFSLILVGIILAFGLKGNKLILVESMLTCIIGPCAAAAAVVTEKLGGNLTSMTTYTFISNFITAMLVPVCFPLINPDLSMSFIQSFLLILYKVCIILVVPMILAYIVKHYMRHFHQQIISVKDLSFYLWGASLSIVTGTTVKHICHSDATVGFLLLIAVLGLILCIIQFACGKGIGAYYGSTIDAGQALGQKNTAFAIWIAYTYLNPLSSVGPGCYILWQNIINSIELWDKRRKDEKK
ncbi:MAG: transporter [Phocaeicola sp.]|uniref:transporter n=1 Tax=Phocaeicola sp. TaxID=2773926 RepID=UPI00234F4C75|nr:transporter [Phocaeicola oris]MCE2615792.1 transporter [Phocaeicola oris]